MHVIVGVDLLFPSIDKLWTAPELLRDPTRALLGTQKGDVYSAAIIMNEITCRTAPYGFSLDAANAEEILAKVTCGMPPYRPPVSLQPLKMH